MEPDLTQQLILQHLSVSLITWLVIMIVGGSIGYTFAFLIRQWFYGHKRILSILVVLPWRSVTIWIALVDIYSPLMVQQLGIGTISARAAIGVALSLLIIPWTTSTLLQSWYPTSTLGKIMSIVRTSAIFSIALVVFLSTGLGYYISRVTFFLDNQKIILGYTVVGAMMLAVDIVIGLIQFALFSIQNRNLNEL